MKINAVISKPKIMKKNYKSPSKALIISFVSIVSGVCLSVILFHFNHAVISDKLMNLFVNFQTDFSNKSFTEIFCGILLGYLPYLFLMSIFGTCTLGALPVTVITFLQSFGLGCLASYIISAYSMRGFEYFLLIIFPGKVLLIFAMLFICEYTISTTFQIKELCEKSAGESFNKKIYLSRVIVFAVMVAASALVDTVTIALFSSLFNLN